MLKSKRQHQECITQKLFKSACYNVKFTNNSSSIFFSWAGRFLSLTSKSALLNVQNVLCKRFQIEYIHCELLPVNAGSLRPIYSD